MIFSKKTYVPPKTVSELMAERVLLEKKIAELDKEIYSQQLKCKHENYDDFENIEGEGYTVCLDCYAQMMRIY